jgi:ABC-type phosphate transport system substrate-binding protein
MKTIFRMTGVLVAVAALHAFAQDGGCDAVATGTPIYIGGSTALQPFVKAIGPAVASLATPYTVFYTGGGSCTGVKNVLDPVAAPLAAGTQFTYYVTSADGGVDSKTCILPDSQNKKLDMAISDVFIPSCGTAAPADVADRLGPAQSMVFVVPKASTQTAITAEEAYITFGFGGVTNKAEPWSDTADTTRAIRNDASGTQIILSGVIGVPAAKWKGTNSSSAAGVFNAVKAASGAAAEKTIGIIGLDYLDQSDTDASGNVTQRRDVVTMLALAAKGQKYAFYPDSTKTSYDKRNLRDGHYAGLGYAHLISKVDGAGAPAAKVKFLQDLLTGSPTTPATAFDVSKVIVQTAHLVPLCAMSVKRDAEGGDLKPYTPAASCACYFESLVGTAPASCKTCSATQACTSGTCRNGYCEAN